MAKSTIDRRRLKKTPVGDMRERILIKERAVSPSDFDNPSAFGEAYKTLLQPWCIVKTNISGRSEFDGVNKSTGGGVILSSTHIFTIRYCKGITSQNIVEYQGNNYEINRIVDPEERHMYLELNCKILGDKTIEANQ